MATDATPPPARPVADVVGVGVLAAAICTAIVVFWFVGAAPDPGPDPADGRRISTIYDPPETGVEAIYAKGDGQLFAAQATDPLVDRPELVRGTEAEQAYRYQRQMYGWLGWLASAGQAGAVAWALIVLTAAAAVLLCVVVADWLAAAGRNPRLALLLLLLPGVLVGLTLIGPEILGTTLVLLGLRTWLRPGGSILLAAGCLAAAGLCRETLLIFPAVAALLELAGRRPRRAFTLAGAALPYVAWVLYLHARIGAWPKQSGASPIDLVPLRGLLDAIDGWDPLDATAAVLLAVLAGAALLRRRTSFATPFIAAHLLLAVSMGERVWRRFPDYSRVLLPLAVLSVLVLLLRDRATQLASVIGGPAPPPSSRAPAGRAT